MEKETLNISLEDAQGVANGDYDNTVYEIVSNKITGKCRWTYRSEIIIKTLSDGRYWKDHYNTGATESQDEGPYEYGKPNFKEVFPKTIETVIYE